MSHVSGVTLVTFSTRWAARRKETQDRDDCGAPVARSKVSSAITSPSRAATTPIAMKAHPMMVSDELVGGAGVDTCAGQPAPDPTVPLSLGYPP